MSRSRLEDRMWSQALEMLERAERMQRGFFEPGARKQQSWQPPADIYETDEHVWAVIALPGVDASGLKVTLRANWLDVHGVRPLPLEAQRGAIHRLELPYGRFQRRLELPSHVYELEGQKLTDGCLYLKLRKVS
ncbi:MAG TPA: Hsp20/alpha crystallin family protein [Gammaproteobacteria bacterium]